MPAFDEMESSFSRAIGARPFLMYARGNAVTAIGLDAGRTAGEAAEQYNRRDE
jgi:hypothetical protein